MNLKNNYQCEGQLSIFDIYNHDLLFGKTFAEPLVQTTEKILEPCLKKPVRWLTKTPMCLDLRKDRNGLMPDVSWVTDIAWLGECMTHSSGVSHKEENAYVYLLTTGGATAPEILFELIGETTDSETYKIVTDIREQSRPEVQTFSEGLSGNIEPSKETWQGTAGTPENGLREAIGGGIKTYDVRISSEGTKNQRAHCYETDRSRALDTGGEKPDSNHGGVAVVGCDLYNQALTGDVTMSITGAATDPHHIPCVCAENNQQSVVCIEGNGVRESHKGDGYKESDTMYTLNTVEQHAVAYGISSYDSNGMKSPNPHSGIYEADTSRTLDLNGGSPACNQGGMAVVECGGGGGKNQSHQVKQDFF